MRMAIRVLPRSSGGGRVFVNNLAQALGRSPACEQVTLFVMGRGDDHLTAPDKVVLDVPSDPLGRRLRGPWAMRQALKARPVDVLLSPGTELTPVAGPLNVMWPLTVAPFDDPAILRLSADARARARWHLLGCTIALATRGADALVFSSHYALGVYGDAIPRTRRLPRTVILPAPSLPAARRLARSVRVPDPYLLFVSHLYPYKMVHELLEGFALARGAGRLPHHLVLAGKAVDPQYHSRSLALATTLGIAEYVHFLGEASSGDLEELYSFAQAFVFSSIAENAGSYALLDAMAYGLPIISSGTSSMPEICQDAARYFDPRSPGQLAEILLEVLLDEQLRADLARRSRDRFTSFPDWDELAEQFLSFVSDALQGHP